MSKDREVILIESKEQIKNTLDLLSSLTLTLDNSGIVDRQLYDGEDLINSTMVVLHVLGNIATAKAIKDGADQDEIVRRADEFAVEFKKLIEGSTGMNIEMIIKRIMPSEE